MRFTATRMEQIPTLHKMPLKNKDDAIKFYNAIISHSRAGGLISKQTAKHCLKAAQLYCERNDTASKNRSDAKRLSLFLSVVINRASDNLPSATVAYKLLVDINNNNKTTFPIETYNEGYPNDIDTSVYLGNLGRYKPYVTSSCLKGLRSNHLSAAIKDGLYDSITIKSKLSESGYGYAGVRSKCLNAMFDVLKTYINEDNKEKTYAIINALKEFKNDCKKAQGRKYIAPDYYRGLARCLANCSEAPDSPAKKLLTDYATKHKKDIAEHVENQNFIKEQLTKGGLFRDVMYHKRGVKLCSYKSGSLNRLFKKISDKQTKLAVGSELESYEATTRNTTSHAGGGAGGGAGAGAHAPRAVSTPARSRAHEATAKTTELLTIRPC